MHTSELARTRAWADTPPVERAVVQYEVEQFLYAEAALLDARRYRDWLALMAEDVEYWMPVRRTVTNADIEREFTKPGEVAYFDDDWAYLEMRVKKLEAGSAWSEDPPSRSRHFVSNVRILDTQGDEITVEACFHVYRTRLERDVDQWVGRRVDVVRRGGGGFLLVKRHLFLDQTVIQSTNMSTIF
ncbi:MAG: aromatic-ring-hydroxylating dioxygenase subunit beta [Phenylobacterium sp.]|uniref:aromatic-ring-hydroxylating dioxygenase subunit beta n=1 Tax=Phenylobacterium sp. TaxID=1871053 RepID=UPI001A3F13B3|nr:aromatic-ring-hydroxylating dioxygenase subunit beta [Phenylobacterium sp.]MBL8552899.1 aromatic-ring-hydroxylating dioxygenase subunit beta [Phenylobacterium sp.]